jgi:hypothetical protein
MGCVGPSYVLLWEAHRIRDLGRNQRPVISRVMTSIVAPKPSVERVAGASHSTVGRIGSHMVL